MENRLAVALHRWPRAAAESLQLRSPRLAATLSGQLPRVRIATYRPAQRTDTQACRIPRRVYSTWVDDRFGRRHARELEALRARNPDMTFVLVDDAGGDAFVAEHFGDHPIARIYERARFAPLRTDIWRYLVLLVHGGWYLDISKGVRGSLSALSTPEASAVITYERFLTAHDVDVAARDRLIHHERNVVNWAFGFAPGHPILQEVIDGICREYPWMRAKRYEDPKQAILRLTGPWMLTRAVHRMAERGELDGVVQCGIEFDATGIDPLPGAWVRHLTVPHYSIATDAVVVD